MTIIIVRSYKRKKDADLVLFGQDVNTRTTGKPAYDVVKNQLVKVETATNEFSLAVNAAKTGDRDKIKLRNQLRKVMEAELDLLCKMMELQQAEESFYTDSGFEIRGKAVRTRQPFEKPIIKTLRQGKLSGTLEGKVQDFPDGVTQLSVEHSMDNGATWENGTYSGGKKFLLQNLQLRQDYLVRCRYHGTHGRYSDWSESAPFFLK